MVRGPGGGTGPGSASSPTVPRRPTGPAATAVPGRGGTGSEITTWVQQTFTPTTVGGRTVYDLTAAPHLTRPAVTHRRADLRARRAHVRDGRGNDEVGAVAGVTSGA